MLYERVRIWRVELYEKRVKSPNQVFKIKYYIIEIFQT